MNPKVVTALLVLSSACGSVVQNAPPTDNPPPDAASMSPDVDAAGSGSATPDATPDAPPPPPAPIVMMETSVRDERADQVSFATGAPFHTHAGAAISLAPSTCPDLYKYGYLTDETAPIYGSEATPNPIAYKFATNQTGTPKYRVRDATSTLIDWTDVAPDTDGSFTVALHRKGTKPLAALDADANLSVDIALDATMLTKCFAYHHLAAPLAFKPMDVPSVVQAAPTDGSEMAVAGGPVQFFEQTFSQPTNEPIDFTLAFEPPTVTYTKAAVDDWVVISDSVVQRTDIPCAPGSTNPVCGPATPADNPDVTTSGTDTTASWLIMVEDVTDPANAFFVPGCEFDWAHPSPTYHCTIPARAVGEAPHQYLAYAYFVGGTDVSPVTGTAATNLSLTGTSYFGVASSLTTQTCARWTNPQQCHAVRTWTQMLALDQIQLTFDHPAFAITTDGKAPMHVPASTFSIPSFTWDSGNADLPGPLH